MRHVLYDLFESCLTEDHAQCDYERGAAPWIVRCGCICHEPTETPETDSLRRRQIAHTARRRAWYAGGRT
jgi:hypothetical protein